MFVFSFFLTAFRVLMPMFIIFMCFCSLFTMFVMFLAVLYV